MYMDMHAHSMPTIVSARTSSVPVLSAVSCGSMSFASMCDSSCGYGFVCERVAHTGGVAS